VSELASASVSQNAVSVFLRTLFVVTVAVMAVRAIQHFGAAAPVAGLLIVTYLAWLSVEIPVTFSRPAQPVAEVGTITAYASARVLVIMTAVLPPVPWPAWSGWMVAPVALFLAGMVLRTVAIRALGAQYTHHVLKRKGHILVTTGPYRFLRHPAYSGMLLANVGFVAFFLNVASVLALSALVVVLVWRIRTEERVLWALPGYPEFARDRSRLLVGVW
jgi:protein-S-isoprenylcysteine O-methyltransferase Ste14